MKQASIKTASIKRPEVILIVRRRWNTLKKIEDRFKEKAKINADLSIFPLKESSELQTQVDKEKSRNHGEVLTPLWLVDKMIESVSEGLLAAKTTHDLCSSWGQFTVRMMRFLKNNKELFSTSGFLKKHAFTEYQLESVYKLFLIFGEKINVYIGDACKLSKLKREDVNNGIYMYAHSKWENVTDDVKGIFKSMREVDFEKLGKSPEEVFVEKMELLKTKLNNDTDQDTFL